MENVTLTDKYPSYAYAGVWMRGFAFLVDLLMIQCLKTIFIGSLDWSLSNKFSWFLGTLIYLAYFILMTKFNHGQTIGKMIFGLQVISLKEASLSWQTVLVREGACRLILKTSFLVLGYLVAIFTKKKQHLGDLFSDTSVVTCHVIEAWHHRDEVNG